MTGGGLHERHHAGVVEPDQLDPGDSLWRRRAASVSSERVGVGQLAVAVGPEHEQPHGLFGGGQVAQEEQAPLVGPLEVVEDQDDGLVLRHRGQQPHHGGEEQVPLGVGVGGLGRREVGDPAGQGRAPVGQLGSVGRDVGQQLVFGGMGDVVAERLGEELVGGGEVLFAVAEQHAGPVVESRPGRLGHQGGLAQTGLARDE